METDEVFTGAGESKWRRRCSDENEGGLRRRASSPDCASLSERVSEVGSQETAESRLSQLKRWPPDV